jgi:DNA-binding NarL/FixJ family response regulator
VHVPVIAMSSDHQPEIVARVMAAGANLFLPKPIAFEKLEAVLTSVQKGVASA